MANNTGLRSANKAKQDEFYTQYEDIQKELNNYEEHFKGKTVLCNCDDPFESNFCKFFLRNFNYLKLKRLICIEIISMQMKKKYFDAFLTWKRSDSDTNYGKSCIRNSFFHGSADRF